MYCAGNPVRLIDPDGREIWITGEDGQKVKYNQGMTYEGNGFIGKTVATLNQINERKGGEKVLSRLTASESIYSIENKEGGAGTMSWGYSPSEDGGSIRAGALMSVSENYQAIEGMGNELFHAYQQDMGQNPLSIDSKVGALLFGKSLVDGFGQLSGGSDLTSTNNFENAISSLLFDFDLTVFQKAVNNFQYGSGLNRPTDKFPLGPYSHFPILNISNPVIKDFYPLLR